MEELVTEDPVVEVRPDVDSQSQIFLQQLPRIKWDAEVCEDLVLLCGSKHL